LLELLTVIAVIAVLAALLLPTLSKGKAQGKSASCKNHLRQMGLALQMYLQDNQNKYPHYLGSPGPSYGDAIGKGGRANGLVYWSSKLFPYYPLNWMNPLFHCPGYTGKISGPYEPGSIERRGSYGYNIFGTRLDDHTNENFGLGPVIFWKDQQGAFVPAVAEAEVLAPSEMLAIGDSAMVVGAVAGTRLGRDAMDAGTDVLRCNLYNGRVMIFDARHGKNYNQLFCDDHVSAMNPRILFNPSNTAAMWNYDHQPHPELW
jgi:hypothetical protein